MVRASFVWRENEQPSAFQKEKAPDSCVCALDIHGCMKKSYTALRLSIVATVERIFCEQPAFEPSGRLKHFGGDPFRCARLLTLGDRY